MKMDRTGPRQERKSTVERDVEKRKAVNITLACRHIYQLTERVRTVFKPDNNLESGLDYDGGDGYLRGFGSTVQAMFPICGLPESGMLVTVVAIVAATSADLEKPNNKLGIQEERTLGVDGPSETASLSVGNSLSTA
jgi:hypothetical protein